MKLDPAEVPVCSECEDKGPCPGRVYCDECGGKGWVSVRCRGYAAQLEKCTECHGTKSFVCNHCEGTGEEPESEEEAA